MFKPKNLAHPNADLVVLNNAGPWFEVAAYDFEQNALVPCGWRYIGDFKGWTLCKYPWDEHMAKNAKDNK